MTLAGGGGGRKRLVWLGLLAGTTLLGVVALLTQRSAALSTPECRLSVPNSTIDPLVFPTKAGSALLDAAIIEGAEPNAIHRLIQEQRGFSVLRGTTCEEIEVGPIYSRVTVTEGPLAGKAVWVPALHTRG
jgi:hypothetical protein